MGKSGWIRQLDFFNKVIFIVVWHFQKATPTDPHHKLLRVYICSNFDLFGIAKKFSPAVLTGPKRTNKFWITIRWISHKSREVERKSVTVPVANAVVWTLDWNCKNSFLSVLYLEVPAVPMGPSCVLNLQSFRNARRSSAPAWFGRINGLLIGILRAALLKP